jgi:hypothetical protein
VVNALYWIRVVVDVFIFFYFVASFIWFVWQLQDIGQRRRFRRDLSAAFLHSQPDWNKVLELARQSPVSMKVAVDEIQKMQRKIWIGKDLKLEPHQALLEGYIKNYRDTEPFDGLPNNIRNPLERIRQTTDPNAFDTILVQIREIISFQERVNRRQRLYTASGFFITLIALLLAAYSYRWPYPALSPTAAQADQVPRK